MYLKLLVDIIKIFEINTELRLTYNQEKNMQKQFRKHVRLEHYDYSSGGYYFITICSKERQNIFARYSQKNEKSVVVTGLAPVNNESVNKIKNNNLTLSPLGKIIYNQWHKIPERYENIDIDEFIIMPNHIHGILIVNKKSGASPDTTISNIVGGFKSISAVEYLKFIKQKNLNISGKIWQRSFYDHIIRDDESLNKIREYIHNNPYTWENDENNLFRLNS